MQIKHLVIDWLIDPQIAFSTGIKKVMNEKELKKAPVYAYRALLASHNGDTLDKFLIAYLIGG